MHDVVLSTIKDLRIGDEVLVELGNPHDTIGYVASQKLKVLQVQKRRFGWTFMGEHINQEGEVQLSHCIDNPRRKPNAPYNTTNSRVVGHLGGETRQIAISSLGYDSE